MKIPFQPLDCSDSSTFLCISDTLQRCRKVAQTLSCQTKSSGCVVCLCQGRWYLSFPSEVSATVVLLNTSTEIFQVGSLCTSDATFETDFRAVSPFLHFPTGQGKRAFSATGNLLSLSRRRAAFLQTSSFFFLNNEHGFVLACQGAYQSKDFTFSCTSLSVQDCPRTVCCY